jgi:hypothetical protein
MQTVIGVVADMGLIIGVGLVHGSWTNRWRMAPGLAELAAHLKSVPMAVGDWAAARREMSPRELAATGATGCLSRTYTNPKTGIAVSVLLLCVLPGDVTVHTPEACYPGAGYTLETPTNHVRRYGSDGQTAEFQTAVARRGGFEAFGAAHLLVLARLEGLVGSPRRTLETCRRADSLQALRHP